LRATIARYVDVRRASLISRATPCQRSFWRVDAAVVALIVALMRLRDFDA